MNIDDKKTDALFKSAFEHFEVPPPVQNWEGVAEELSRDIDEDFKSRLQALKVAPATHNWDNIQKELPLHSGMRRYFSWMNKIAVVLVIGMLLSILSDQNRQSISASADSAEDAAPTPTLPDPSNSAIPSASTNSDFVFDLTKRNSFRKHPHQFSSQEELYLKSLLQFILEDNDELTVQADSNIIQNSLSPATPSYVGEVLAHADQQLPELQISIPLIIVENEAEAERLIEIYDANHATVEE